MFSGWGEEVLTIHRGWGVKLDHFYITSKVIFAKASTFGIDEATKVISVLKIIEELYSEIYNEVEEIKLATLMLHGKPQVWWGQFKVDQKTRNQFQVEIWMEFSRLFMA